MCLNTITFTFIFLYILLAKLIDQSWKSLLIVIDDKRNSQPNKPMKDDEEENTKDAPRRRYKTTPKEQTAVQVQSDDYMKRNPQKVSMRSLYVKSLCEALHAIDRVV